MAVEEGRRQYTKLIWHLCSTLLMSAPSPSAMLEVQSSS